MFQAVQLSLPDLTGVAAGLSVAAIVGLTGATVTYLVARRTTRGTVQTSDAATLWAEANALRSELRLEVVGLRQEILSLNQRILELEATLRAQTQEIARLTSELREARDK